MNKIIIKTVCFLVLFSTMAFDVPKGWVKAGSMGSKYDVAVLWSEEREKQVAYLRSVEDEIDGFGTLMQQFSAADYKGQRIQFSAWIKSEDVGNWAGLWMRVDQKAAKNPIAFDNMASRPVTGDTEWKEYNITLDIPVYADLISFGVMLNGTGRVLIDAVSIEVVTKKTPTTAPTLPPDSKAYPSQPVNLEFKQ